MTVSKKTGRWSYPIDGVTVSFGYDNVIYAATDLLVFDKGLLINSGYTVTQIGNPDGGDVVFDTAPTVTGEIVIVSAIPDEQPTKYPEGDDFPAASHETALDRRTRVSQQVQAKLDLALRLPVSDAALSVAELPDAASRRKKFVQFADDAGALPVLVDLLTSGSLAVTAYTQTLLDDVDAAAARATLEIGNGNALILDLDGDSSLRAESDDLVTLKLGGVDLFRWSGNVASLVNGIDFIGSITGGVGNGPVQRAVGPNTHIALIFEPKGDGNLKVRAKNFVLEMSDDGAATGPKDDAVRFSNRPALNDNIASRTWKGNNDNTPQDVVTYGEIVGVITSPTSGAESGRLDMRTRQAGVEDTRLRLGAGLYTKNATGGDRGVDSMNASALYEDNVRVVKSSGTTGGAASAGAGNQYLEITIAGTTYKVLHDGTV